MKLFTQNEDLKQAGIWGWTLPAHIVTLTNGDYFNTCPHAGICAAFCYAKTGRWLWSNVRKSHIEKLELVLYNLPEFERIIIEELQHKRYTQKFIRIHDGGDFFSSDYAQAWLRIAKAHPDKLFYAYTKEVSMFKQFTADHRIPSNFVIIYSYGGREDSLIDSENDRHSDVFPDLNSLLEAGYFELKEDDTLAATSENKKVGLVRNNIPHMIKKMGDKRFSQWQKGDRPVGKKG